MSEVLIKNLKLLEKFQPNVYKKILSYEKGEYKPKNNSVERILLAKQDDFVINMLVVCNGNEYLICDHEDPITQSYIWIDKFVDPSNKADIVFGMGMGYHLEILLTSFENKKVIIVEPNIELFYQLLKIRNLELIIEKSEIYLDEGVDSILGRLHTLLWDTTQGGIQCQPFEVYGEMFWNLWDELRSKFIKHAESFSVDIATRRYFGDLWVHNNIKNLSKIIDSSNANGLVGNFKGVPGILVSAGPSLNKNIHLLNELKDKAVIMAAGTAVNILEAHDILPHFMVAIDASEEAADIQRKVKSTEIYYLYANQASTGSIQDYKGPGFLMNYPIDIFTSDFLKFANIESPYFLSGPSVANTCVDVLYKMGCNPIILLGQDLAFSGGNVYASQGDTSGNLTEELDTSQFIKTKDIYGKDVYTKSEFVAMKNWFEGYFEKVKDSVEIINATEGGVDIEFSKNEKLLDVVRKLSNEIKPIGEQIQRIYESNRFDVNIAGKLSEYKLQIESEIAKLEEYSQSQLKLVDLIRKDIYNPGKDKKAFDKIVYKINDFTNMVTSSPIYHSVLKNLIELEFYLIKREVDRATEGLSLYSEVKDIYIYAIQRQNEILIQKLDRVKELLKNL